MRPAHVVLAVLLAALPGATAAAPAARTLRVCADPAGMPLSNERGEGVENELAAHLARAMGAELETTWWASRRGFFRNTLGAGRCDVVLSVPARLDAVTTTKPYFRSTFAFVTRRDRSDLEGLRSFDDPRLGRARIGVPLAGDDGANPTPVHALARRGIVDGVRGYPLYAELGRDLPAIVSDVATGAIDVGVLWGPIAGASVKAAGLDVAVTPVREESDDGRPLAFDIAVGVRKGNVGLARELDEVLAREREAITRILAARGVPLLPLEGGGRAR